MVMGSIYVTYAIGLLISIMVARSLGPDDFGRYSYVIWMAGILISFSNNALTLTVIRFVSESLGRRSPESARSVHGRLLRAQWACLTLSGLLFVGLSPFFAPDGWEGHLSGFVAVALLAGLAKALYLFDASVAKGYGRFDVEARTTVAMSFVSLVLVLVLLYHDAPLMGYLVAFTIVSIGHPIMTARMLRKGGLIPSRAPLDPELSLRMRRHFSWTLLLVLAYTLSNKSIETYLLNATVGPAEVGFFAIAAALSRGGIDLLSSGLMTVLMPIMAHAFGEGGVDRANAIMASALRYCFFLGLLLIGVGMLASEAAVALMYGEQYSAVVMPLRVMILVGGLILGESAFNALLSTTDNQRLRVVFSCMSIIVAVVFAFLLVPRYGLVGAVASYAISQLLVFVAMAIGITKMMHLKLEWAELFRLLVAAILAGALAMSLVLAVPGMWTELAASVVFALAFVAGTIFLRAWRSADVAHVVDFLARYPFLHDRLAGALGRWSTRLR